MDKQLMALDNLVVYYFHPFGLQGTLDRLRAAVGLAPTDEWTSDDVLRAVDLVDHGYRSWAAFRDARIAERRHAKAIGQPSRDSRWWPPLDEWLAGYAAEPAGAGWQARELGNCSTCGHPWVHHAGLRPCAACQAEQPFQPDRSGVDRRSVKWCDHPIPSLL
jgi:hypothetical protein